jgi:hypothetical protein
VEDVGAGKVSFGIGIEPKRPSDASMAAHKENWYGTNLQERLKLRLAKGNRITGVGKRCRLLRSRERKYEQK